MTRMHPGIVGLHPALLFRDGFHVALPCRSACPRTSPVSSQTSAAGMHAFMLHLSISVNTLEIYWVLAYNATLSYWSQEHTNVAFHDCRTSPPRDGRDRSPMPAPQ